MNYNFSVSKVEWSGNLLSIPYIGTVSEKVDSILRKKQHFDSIPQQRGCLKASLEN